MIKMDEKMEKLRTESLRLYNGMAVVKPVLFTQVYINLHDVNPTGKNQVYSVNSSIIVFSCNGEVFAIPYTRSTIKILESHCFKEDYLAVPFGSWDYPMYERTKWEIIRAKAKETYKKDFEEDCQEYCLAHGIKKLSDEVLANCFEIPRTGMKARNAFFERTYYPLADMEKVSQINEQYIGRYSSNNGKVVFVNDEGRTFVTKGYGIKKKLEEAGYTEDHFNVPLSNGEEILDKGLKAKWNAIKEIL